MQITDIRPQKKRQGFFNIFVDGKYSFAVSAEILLKHKLKSGQDLSQEKIDEIIKKAEFGKWFDATLKFLSYRPHSRSEVSSYLKRKQVGDAIEKAIIEKLIRLKFLDDREFAKWFVAQRQTFRPKGKQLIKLELLNKGIAKDIIEQVISVPNAVVSEADLAWKAVEKKLALWKNFSGYDQSRRISNYLARRGFSWDIIKDVCKRVRIDDTGQKE